MDRRGESVVKFPKRANAGEAREVELVGETLVFFADFGTHRPQETLHIEPVRAQRELARRAREIAGHGKRDRAVQPRRKLGRPLAEVFEREIAAEAEADQVNGGGRVIGQRVANDRVQIFSRAAVVHPQQTVRLVATTAEIPGEHVPAAADQGAGHALNILRLSIRFEAVAEDRKAGAALGGPFEIHKIAVGQLQAL